MAIASGAAKTGDTLAVKTFTGNVLSVNSLNGTVRISDQDGYTHYVAIGQLTKVLPYTDGATYIDSYSNRYTWAAATQTWVNDLEVPRAFDYPVRPLFKITLGDAFTD
jgi:hypothetical protein